MDEKRLAEEIVKAQSAEREAEKRRQSDRALLITFVVIPGVVIAALVVIYLVGVLEAKLAS